MPCLQRLAVSFVFEGAEEVARQRFMKHVDLTMQRVGGGCASGCNRLESDIAEILPTGSSRCIAVTPKICCHEFEQQSQTAQ